MLNHSRTLLLNKSRRDTGDALIPEEFVPLVLSDELYNIDNFIFSVGEDRYHSLDLILTIIHSNDLHKYTTLVDPRITYLKRVAYCAPEDLEPGGPVVPITLPTLKKNPWGEYVPYIEDLYACYTGSPEYTLKYGALALLHMFNLEELRTRNEQAV